MKNKDFFNLFIQLSVILFLSLIIINIFKTPGVDEIFFPANLSLNSQYPEIKAGLKYLESDFDLKNKKYLSFDINIPLFKEDYYLGKFENAKAAVNEFNSKNLIINNKSRISLIRGNILTASSNLGYTNTEEGFGYGMGWFVTSLGGLIDEVNSKWIVQYGYPLFIITEKHPHSKKYKTYFPNNGYGYAVYKSSDYLLDYSFKLNENAKNIEYVNFYFESIQNDPIGYKGLSISGKVFIFFKE